MAYQNRYLAIRHDGKAIILEGEYGEHYQYAARDVRSKLEAHARMLRSDDLPDDGPMCTKALSAALDTSVPMILRSCPVHGPSGRFRLFLPADWTSEECEAWLAANKRMIRIGPALDDPHQTNRSRQMERHFHGS